MSTPLKLNAAQLRAQAQAEAPKSPWTRSGAVKSFIAENLDIVAILRKEKNYTWRQVSDWLKARDIKHSSQSLQAMYGKYQKEGNIPAPVRAGKTKTKPVTETVEVAA